MARELLLRDGYVVTLDNSICVLPEGDVLSRDDQIAAIGRNLSTYTQDAEAIDASGRLVIPGLVDTHRHVWQGAIGGFTPQMTGAGYEPAVLLVKSNTA
jgi:5-methylthioadenosine/S-adenosylhomocysteine deaminase